MPDPARKRDLPPFPEGLPQARDAVAMAASHPSEAEQLSKLMFSIALRAHESGLTEAEIDAEIALHKAERA